MILWCLDRPAPSFSSQRFPKEIGIITGIVGAVGGAGGFSLPTALGSLKQWTGTFAGGFALFAVGSLVCAVLLQFVTGKAYSSPAAVRLPWPSRPTYESSENAVFATIASTSAEG
jgi:nitrate/nitrite transporter NarK